MRTPRAAMLQHRAASSYECFASPQCRILLRGQNRFCWKPSANEPTCVDPFAGECVAWCAEGTIFPVEKRNRECLPSSRAPARPNRKAFVVPQLQFLISSCDVARHKRISVCELHL